MPGVRIIFIIIRSSMDSSRRSGWPYSTFHRYVLLGLYPRDWAGSALARTQGGYDEPDE